MLYFWLIEQAKYSVLNLESISDDNLLKSIYYNYGPFAFGFEVFKCNPKESIFVLQEEVAVFNSNSGSSTVEYIGSDDATTCHILIIRCEYLKCFVVAHLSSVSHCLRHVKRVRSLLFHSAPTTTTADLKVDVFLLGGFCDDDPLNFSEQLTCELIRSLAHVFSDVDCFLQSAVVSSLNTDFGSKKPRHYGCAMNVKTGKFGAAMFSAKGPGLALRGLQYNNCSRGELVNCYDCLNDCFVIKPFSYQMDIYDKRIANRMTDKEILKYLSTSPNAEPDDFCEFIRSMSKFKMDNPNSDVVFNNGPIVLKRY